MRTQAFIRQLWGATLLLCAPIALASAPRVVVDEPQFNFGSQSNTQVIDHTFVLRNEGDAPLNIERVRSSCGCTVGHISSRHVLPGETAEISGRFNLAGRRGSQRSVLTVETNDPRQPRVQLIMAGEALMGVSFRPAGLFFEATTAGQRQERELDLIGVPGEAFEIVATKIRGDRFAVGDPVRLAPHHYRLPVTFTAAAEVGSMQDVLEVQTDHPHHPHMTAPLHAVVLGAVTYSPREILLSADQQNPVTRFVIVRPGGALHFEITAVEVPGEATTHQVLRLPNQGYRIQIGNLSPSAEVLSQPVRLHTNLDAMPLIEIPIVMASP